MGRSLVGILTVITLMMLMVGAHWSVSAANSNLYANNASSGAPYILVMNPSTFVVSDTLPISAVIMGAVWRWSTVSFITPAGLPALAATASIRTRCPRIPTTVCFSQWLARPAKCTVPGAGLIR
jgi:hypothetical protein